MALGEKNKNLIKIIIEGIMIVFLIVFLVFRVLSSGDSKSKTFLKIQEIVNAETSIEKVEEKVKDYQSSNKNIEYRIREAEDKKGYYLDIKYNNDIQTFTIGNGNLDEVVDNEPKEEVQQNSDKEIEINNNDDQNIDDSTDDEETDLHEIKTKAEKEAKIELDTKAKELYQQVTFSLKNNKVVETLEEDLKDIGKEAKKKGVTFSYSIKDKLDGEYVIVTTINNTTYRNNFKITKIEIEENVENIDNNTDTIVN